MFLPGHRSLVAHAECAGTPRVMREAQMKTPNREQLGAEFWWCHYSTQQTNRTKHLMAAKGPIGRLMANAGTH